MGREGAGNSEYNAISLTILLCGVVLLCLSAGGCGYTFATTPLTSDYATIAAPAFKNRTIEEDLQIRFNNILVRKLAQDGRLRVVDDPAAADLVLSGTLTSFDPRAISFVHDDDIGQFRVTVISTASLLATRSNEVLWRNEALTGTDFYLTRGGRSREEAIDDALEDLAERIIYEALDSYW